ncbi:unnamed protein product [Brassica oleracea]
MLVTTAVQDMCQSYFLCLIKQNHGITLALQTSTYRQDILASETDPSFYLNLRSFVFCVDSRPSCWLSQHAVDGGLSKWLDMYSVLMVRVLVNWFPNIPWDRQPLSAIRDVCDPYLNLFRNIIPFVFVVYLSLWEDAASMFSGVLTPAERTQSVMVDTTVNPKIFGGERSKNSKVFRPVMEEEIRKKKVESWCKAVERTFDRILECVIVEAWLKRSRKKWGLRPMKGNALGVNKSWHGGLFCGAGSGCGGGGVIDVVGASAMYVALCMMQKIMLLLLSMNSKYLLELDPSPTNINVQFFFIFFPFRCST